MPAVGELLKRFRRVGAPGAPAPSGAVPEDATASLQAELRPLIAAVDELEEEAEALVREAAAGAARVREVGAREAEQVLEEGRRRAAALRLQSIEDGLWDEDSRTVLARADAESTLILQRARRRIPGLAACVLRCVTEEPPEPPAGLAARPDAELDDVAGLGRR